MEPKKMESESLNLEDNGDHQTSSSEDSLASDVLYDDSPVHPTPRIGSEYQAEIPNLATKDERRELMASSLNGSTTHGYGYPIVVGLALPIMSASSSEVTKKEEELQMQFFSESETGGRSGDMQNQVILTCPINKNAGKCDPTFKDQHTVVPAVQTECDTHQSHDKMAPCTTQEGLNVPNYPGMQKIAGTEQLNPLPYSHTALWTDLEAGLFLLGLYLFGKNLILLSMFLGTKTVGDVLSYYYGKFYQSDAYKRWSDCRKAKTRKRILGERIFQGRRQKELISRLKSKIPKEAHDSLTQVFKSFSDSQTSLKEFVFALKSIVGTEVFVEAVGVGKGKDDLTEFVTDQSKPNQALTAPSGKDWSSLALEDIIKLLTDDSRKGKARSNDIFWEAVWPRLLGKGWHSEQPKDVRKAKNCIVFLVPGIKRFSRSKLTKGTHYFDSVSDVLKKVAADPVLLELEADGVDHGLAAETNGSITDMELKQDSPLDGYQELPKFPIVDTSLVEGEEPFNVLEMRNLPADAKFSFVPTHHAPNMVSYSSSEEEDASSDRLSDGQEEGRGRVTAEVQEIEMVTGNGHCSSNGNGNTFDSTGIKTEPERRKYLSPVSKRRRLTESNSGMKADGGAPSIWNSNMCRDPSEATGSPVTVSQQPEPAALEANPRRHGTRNRPPTARALEAIAFGLLGTGKGKKGDLKNMARNRPSQPARKADTKDHVPTASSGGTESSDWNVKAIKGAESMFK
ncbi:hypothetical protein SEVIR_3G382900v4 [Setaria viridis]